MTFWLAQRAEAQRLSRELMSMLEEQTNSQARAAFANRLDESGRVREHDRARSLQRRADDGPRRGAGWRKLSTTRGSRSRGCRAR